MFLDTTSGLAASFVVAGIVASAYRMLLPLCCCWHGHTVTDIGCWDASEV
jgi:hypothetical protein